LAAAFAIALGVKVGNGGGGGSISSALSWRRAPNWTKLAVSICVWLYFIVGGIVFATYLRDIVRATSYAPPELNDFALVFAGYAASFLTVFLATNR
jgi:phosphotransferase system  glucose/maltose/N-acetylglucosamine-specific IIC component